MSVWADIHKRSNGVAVRKEDQFYAEAKYSLNNTCKDFSTIWITYSCEGQSFRKRARIWHECVHGLWITERDVWGFLRKRVGERIDNLGVTTMKDLKKLVSETENFQSEDWGDGIRDFVWKYGGYSSNYKELDEVYEKQCKIDKTLITTPR